jgi:hypothetical protein
LGSPGVGPFAGNAFAMTQTGSDAREMDTQTETAERRSVTVQCPEDLGLSRVKPAR